MSDSKYEIKKLYGHELSDEKVREKLGMRDVPGSPNQVFVTDEDGNPTWTGKQEFLNDRAALLLGINGKERFTIEWDGVTTGLDYVGTTYSARFYKFSDHAPSFADMLDGNPEISNNGVNGRYIAEYSPTMYDGGYTLFDCVRVLASGSKSIEGTYVFVALEAGATLVNSNYRLGVEFPTPGIYFAMPSGDYAASFSFDGIGCFDDSLISDRIARVTQLETADEHMETRLAEEIAALYKLISDRLEPPMLTRQLLRGTISGAYENDTVTTIRPYAFMFCYDLTSVAFPAVTHISEFAFQHCSALTDINFPSVETIGQQAFCQCDALVSITLPSALKSLGARAFYLCDGLTSVTFTSTPNSIAVNAFDSCPNLTLISVPWSEGEVANAPWGATNAKMIYNVGGENT